MHESGDVGVRTADALAWSNRHLSSLLRRAAAGSPDKLAVVDGSVRLTYRELNHLADAVTDALAGAGIESGDVVSWQLPNWWEAVVIHHGIIGLGAISNPLLTILRERELSYMLRNSGSRLLFAPSTFRGVDHASMLSKLRAGLPDLESVVIVRPGDDEVPSFTDFINGRSAPPPVVRASRATDATLLLYTSGTEANPKGALHSHNTLDYEIRTIVENFDLSSEDVVFMPSPLPHITGVCYGIHLPVMLQAPVVLQDVWDAKRGLDLIESEGCSFTVAATPFLRMLCEEPSLSGRDLSAFRNFACGGADVSPSLVRSASERLGLPVVRVYGSTEFPTLSCGRPSDPLDRRAETDGYLLGRAEVRCIDEEGLDLPAGCVGELLVRGPELFLGYLDPEITARSMIDGWFSTGDLGTIEPDGAVVIRGRKKDIIIRGGENISAKEVEDLLLQNPDLQEVAVVASPDPVMVERVCAFVVARHGSSPSLPDIVAELRRHGLMPQKLPERLVVVDELPKTASGKIKKFELRARLKESETA